MLMEYKGYEMAIYIYIYILPNYTKSEINESVDL